MGLFNNSRAESFSVNGFISKSWLAQIVAKNLISKSKQAAPLKLQGILKLKGKFHVIRLLVTPCQCLKMC